MYTITDLGSFGGTGASSLGRHVNNAGIVVGEAAYSSQIDHAFEYQANKLQDLTPDLKAGHKYKSTGYSTAASINDASPAQIVGSFQYPGTTAIRGALWTDGILTDLSTLDLTGSPTLPGQGRWFPYDINDGGIVAGTLNFSGFRLDLATHELKTLAFDGDNDSVATGVNAQGKVVGWSSGPGSWRGFLYNGVLNPLPSLGGDPKPSDINDSDQIVGEYNDPDGKRHAFLYDGGSVEDIQGLGAEESAAFGINNNGEIVGWASLRTPEVAVRWTAESKASSMQDLNDWLVDGSGWLLNVAYHINDSGQIVGVGMHNGVNRAFLLTPTRITQPWGRFQKRVTEMEMDPLAIIFGSTSATYIRWTLPDPPPIDVVMARIRELTQAMGPEEKMHALARAKTWSVYPKLLEQVLSER